MSGEVLNNTNPTPYSLPTASDEVKGGVKVGSGLTMDGEVLKLAATGMKIYYKDFTFPTLSGVEIASGFYITGGNNTVDFNVDGYTPIACIAKDTYAHDIIASMRIYRFQNVDRYRLGPVISSDNSITSDDFTLRVYYVSSSDVVALS